jgi:tight adherence protein C
MSPNVFAGLVAGTIVVSMLALVAMTALLLRARGESRLRRRLAPEPGGTVEFGDRVQRPLLSSVARGGKAIEGLVDSEGESGRLLMQAGWRGGEQRLLWYVFQGVLPVIGTALVLGFWMFSETPNKGMLTLLFGIIAAVLSFLLPRWILRGVAGSRRQRIKNEVPLFIHLLTLLFEAGLSTRQALASMVREGAGVLPELGRELDLLLRQIEAGAETSEALKNMSDALDVDDLGTVLSVLRQVDRYGGEVREPLLEALEVIEERRSLDLRERVNLLSGRMTVVMVLFFFPALMVFVAGPAFLALIRALGDVNG